MVACSLMVPVKKEDAEGEKSTTDDWKRGGMIGAAALTGGTLMALTGGMESVSLYIADIYFSLKFFPIFLEHKQSYKFTVE